MASAWLALSAATAPDFAAAARAIDAAIARDYAYPEKLPGGELPRSAALATERAAVHDETSLLHYAEDRMMSLADHHAITGSSFKDSWAVVPTYADLWIVVRDGRFVVDAVRDDSPAARAGIVPGDRLVAVGGIETSRAVRAFWGGLGLDVTPRRAEFAARILAAGRRDRDRQISVADATGRVRQLSLRSLYANRPSPSPLAVSSTATGDIIRFNNSLGDDGTITAFDTAMARLPHDHALILDLRETPSGGNTTVARAILGWFVDAPRGYQVHNRPAEQRETGIARQWIEQVLPRGGKYRDRLPTVWVGRWTGSMGEGLAVGFATLGAEVRGDPMAGLNGSVEDLAIDGTDLVIKLPTERLMTTTYQPREDFRPKALR